MELICSLCDYKSILNRLWIVSLEGENQMFLYESLLYFLIKGQTPRIKRKKKPWRRWKKIACQKYIMGENTIHVSLSSYLIQSPQWTLGYFPHSSLKPWAWDPHTQLWDEITGWTQQVSSQYWPSHMATTDGKHGGELLALGQVGLTALLPGLLSAAGSITCRHRIHASVPTQSN